MYVIRKVLKFGVSLFLNHEKRFTESKAYDQKNSKKLPFLEGRTVLTQNFLVLIAKILVFPQK